MTSNTDPTPFVYSTEHMRVKAYTGGALATVAEVGFDGLEWLLKHLSASRKNLSGRPNWSLR
jgi:hypothetical protein